VESEFHNLIDIFKSHGIKYPDGNQYAFTVTTNSGSWVVYNSDCGLDKDTKEIVISHELAHVVGINDEEEADRFALTRLNKKRRKILIDQWGSRHGHAYMPKM
jgi:hypothetical protein